MQETALCLIAPRNSVGVRHDKLPYPSLSEAAADFRLGSCIGSQRGGRAHEFCCCLEMEFFNTEN